MDVVTTLKEIQARTADLQAAVSKALREAAPWTPREYAIDMITEAGSQAFTFGVEMLQEGSRFHDIPETGITVLGMEHDFQVDALRINDEDAPHFSVGHLVCDVRTCWTGSGGPIPATRFSESSPPLNVGMIVDKGLTVTLYVVNNSDTPRRFRARIVGQERKDIK